MTLLTTALPIIGTLVDILRSHRTAVATQTGISEKAVDGIGDFIQDYLSKDERALKAVMDEIERARQFDIATSKTEPPVVNLLRGLVRPVITLTAFAWYLLARLNGVPLSMEDYTIIGGIIAFWFGFRSFDKRAV